MILILIALIAITSIATWAKIKSHWANDFGDALCGIISFIGFVGLFIYCFIVFAWISAGYEKDIINREYGTNYTQEEVFYASSVIETVRELNRRRIEINGDLITGK